MFGSFFRKFACFTRTNDAALQNNGEDSYDLQERTRNIAEPVPALTRTASSSIDIPTPSESSNWWLSHQAPIRSTEKMAPKRLLTSHYLNESRMRAYEMVPISRRTTEDVRSDDSFLTQLTTVSQEESELQDEVPQPQSTTSQDPPATIACNEQGPAPRGALIKIGIIVRSRDGSWPRVIPLNPQQHVPSNEALIQAALSYEELGRNGITASTCEHIFYNTQSGKVELDGGHFEQEYII